MKVFKLQSQSAINLDKNRVSHKLNTNTNNQLIRSMNLLSNSKAISLALGLIAAVITAVVYLPSLKNDFTNWDDPAYVLENADIRDFNLETLKFFLNRNNPVSLNYHPLTMISLAFDYHRAAKGKLASAQNLYPGYEAKYYHQTNYLIHILNTLLVFWLIWFLAKKRIWIAFLTALLFGIHPMHVESVAWISERKDVLYTFFYLAALLSYYQYNSRQKSIWLLISFLLFIPSLLSKAVAVSLPVMLILFDIFQGRKPSAKVFLEKLPFLGLSIVFGLMAINIQAEGAIAKEGVLSLFDRMIFASYGFVFYLIKLFAPLQLSAFYPYPIDLTGDPLPSFLYLFPAILIGLFVIVFILFRKQKIWWFSFLFFMITIALVIQIIPVGKAVMADRYTYIPYIGLFFLIAFYFDFLFIQTNKSKLIRYGATIIMSLWLGWLITLTNDQIKVWYNTESLWTQAIENHPRAYVAYKNRGNFYGQKGEVDKAMRDYEVLLRQAGEADGQTWGNVGNIYRMREQYDLALDAYEKQVQLSPEDYKGYINRGIIFSIMNNQELALLDYQEALNRKAPPEKVLLNRALTYTNLKMYPEAIEDYSRMEAIQALNPDIYSNRGVAYFNSNQFEKAVQDFNLSLKLSPDNPNMEYNLAISYYRLNQMEQARAASLRAEKLGYPVSDNFKRLIGIINP